MIIIVRAGLVGERGIQTQKAMSNSSLQVNVYFIDVYTIFMKSKVYEINVFSDILSRPKITFTLFVLLLI